jgi:hypothetical protein
MRRSAFRNRTRTTAARTPRRRHNRTLCSQQPSFGLRGSQSSKASYYYPTQRARTRTESPHSPNPPSSSIPPVVGGVPRIWLRAKKGMVIDPGRRRRGGGRLSARRPACAVVVLGSLLPGDGRAPRRDRERVGDALSRVVDPARPWGAWLRAKKGLGREQPHLAVALAASPALDIGWAVSCLLAREGCPASLRRGTSRDHRTQASFRCASRPLSGFGQKKGWPSGIDLGERLLAQVLPLSITFSIRRLTSSASFGALPR